MNEFSFNDLLPGSVKDDPKFKAASKCLDSIFSNFRTKAMEMLIYARLDELDNQTLDDLAWQWNLNHHEGYSLLTSMEEKRDLIRNAIKLKKYKGTRWSLERIGEILNMPITIVEWWENVENGMELEPYEFDMFVDSGIRGVTDKFYSDVYNLLNSLKNVRSHLRSIRAFISSHGDFYVGAITYQTALIHIYPDKI
jgi:phage tail P2-like protein